jgi:hypothetical protein
MADSSFTGGASTGPQSGSVIGDLIRYAAARLRFRGEQNRRFIEGGLGIAERAKRLDRYWSLHHNASRLAQIDWRQNVPRGTPLTVIGAGQLRDAAWAELSAHFGEITLVDADPLAPHFWKAAAKGRSGVHFEVRDVTASAERWLDRVSRDLPRSDWAEALEWIRRTHEGQPAPPRVDTAAAISLNLLGQIPLWWQDSVEHALMERFGRKQTLERQEEWLAALEPSAGWIVEEHLRSLSNTQYSLVITDVEYLHYRGCPAYSASQYSEPPVRWSEGKWQPEFAGLHCEVEPALYSVDPDADETWTRVLPTHRLSGRDHWLWHLSPLGTESEPFGLLHRVGAYRLERI